MYCALTVTDDLGKEAVQAGAAAVSSRQGCIGKQAMLKARLGP